MKKNNKMVLIIVLGLIAIALLIGGIFVARDMIDEKNDKIGRKDGSRPMFYTDAGKELELNIVAINEGIPSGQIITSQNLEVNLSLTNNYNASSGCTYDFFWEWSDTAYGYYKTKSKAKELTITGEIDGIKLFEDMQINDYNLANPRTFLASYAVINEGNGMTPLSLQASLNFYKIGENQDNHSDKSYKGKIVIDNISCTGTTKIKEKDLSVNNYICLSHGNNPYCPEDNLYQVLEVSSSGIKVVRTKDYGTATWQENLLNDSLVNYIKTNLNGYQKIILDSSWPVASYANNITLEEALANEKNAEKVVKAPVGLLSYSDILKHDYLKSYNTPYLILGGGSYTNTGFRVDGKLGLVFPCLYLDSDIVASRGNGTISSPYYII